MRQVLPFDWLTTEHLVSGESTLHQVTLFSARSRIFLPLNPVLRGSILLPPRHPSVFARMARWQLFEKNPSWFAPDQEKLIDFLMAT